VIELILKLYPLNLVLGIVLLALADTFGPWRSTLPGFLLFCGAVAVVVLPVFILTIWYFYFYELSP
jgi:hypothetical protein